MGREGGVMLSLPEVCEFCRREVRALERVIVLLNYVEKRVVEVTFRESVTEGVCCMNCVPDAQREEARRRCTEPEVTA